MELNNIPDGALGGTPQDHPANFVAEISEIERLLKALPKPIPVPISLTADDIAEGTVDNHFSCPVCLMIVSDAQECVKCDKLFCKDCIDTCCQKKPQCPACNQVYEGKGINRMLKSLLNALTFKCPVCAQVFKYEDKEMHAQSHQSFRTVDCPLRCGQTCEGGESGVWKHLADECPLMLLQCRVCEAEVMRTVAENHNCIEYLKNSLKQYRQELADQRQVVQRPNSENVWQKSSDQTV